MIFLLHDQNMTKNNTHAQDANHDNGLTKTSKNDKKNTFSKIAHRAKVCRKQYRINIFVLNDQKMHPCPKC